jgi:hypothetical protein
MPRALVIEVDGSHRLLELSKSEHAQASAIHEALGGYLEYVEMPNGLSMFCNEHGKIEGMEVNVRATKLSGLFPRDVIAGPVVIMGEIDRSTGETLGLTDEQLDELI